jgi:N-methylhydantoinase A
VSKISIGIDVGGTFTDIVLFDPDAKEIHIAKVPSTPKHPNQSVISGIEDILHESPYQPEDITFLGHGTTVATNTIIEKKGAKVGLITTDGFRDVLEMGRQKRPSVYDYNLDSFTPVFMVPRRRRLGIKERINYCGQILTALDLDAAEQIFKRFQNEGVESIAVCLLFSFLNPAHENLIAKLAEEKYPHFSISLSSNVLPEFREYERSCATVFNAYVSPIIDRYLKALEKEITAQGIQVPLSIMQSNGGLTSASVARQRSILTFLSGPSAGVMGAAFTGKIAGFKNMISLDIGGTSTDVSLIKNGIPSYTTDNEIEGYPLKIQMIDIHTVGAGGGSIAWIDSGGALKSGPQSSGADPGPACYNTGGRQPTNTDANLLLGYLSEDSFLGGKMRINKDLGLNAIEEIIAKPLKIGIYTASNGIFTIACANMIGAIRKVSVLRGYDPRDYWLFTFGGSGPVYASRLAAELKMKGVIVPKYPGVQSSFGILTVDHRHDLVKTSKIPVTKANMDPVRENFSLLEEEAHQIIANEGLEGKVALHKTADMRYIGQAYEINVPIHARLDGNDGIEAILSDFHQKHKEIYKHCDIEAPVEFINFRTAASVLTKKPDIQRQVPVSNEVNPKAALKGRRKAFFAELEDFCDTPVYHRDLLMTGNRMEGPAIVEQLDSTTVVFPGQTAEVDAFLNIIIRLS